MKPKPEPPETICCSQCGATVDYEESGSDDICYECYRESLIDCQLCGEGVEEEQVSPYILVKTEFAETGNRIPGIYRIRRKPFMTCNMIGSDWLHGGDILFVDRLPKPDARYEISGNICGGCARRHGYPAIDRAAYGQSWASHILARRERERVQEVISEHPEVLLDLETDMVPEELHLWCPMPVFAPTYRPLVFVHHQGVKIYRVGGESFRGEPHVGWLTLRPEPSFRDFRRGFGFAFAPSGLSTWEGIKLDPDRAKDAQGHYYDDGYRYGHEHDYRQAARKACIRAIEQGIITQRHAPEDAR